MSDKEILIQAANKYVQDLAEKLFNLRSLASRSIITYVMQNLEEKYGKYIDFFVDKNNNINMSLLGNAVKEELKQRGGYILSMFGQNIKFSEKDIEEFVSIYNNFKNAEVSTKKNS